MRDRWRKEGESVGERGRDGGGGRKDSPPLPPHSIPFILLPLPPPLISLLHFPILFFPCFSSSFTFILLASPLQSLFNSSRNYSFFLSFFPPFYLFFLPSTCSSACPSFSLFFLSSPLCLFYIYFSLALFPFFYSYFFNAQFSFLPSLFSTFLLLSFIPPSNVSSLPLPHLLLYNPIFIDIVHSDSLTYLSWWITYDIGLLLLLLFLFLL